MNDVMKGTPEEHPPIGALGYALTALNMYEPWLMEITVPDAAQDELDGWYDGDDPYT